MNRLWAWKVKHQLSLQNNVANVENRLSQRPKKVEFRIELVANHLRCPILAFQQTSYLPSQYSFFITITQPSISQNCDLRFSFVTLIVYILSTHLILLYSLWSTRSCMSSFNISIPGALRQRYLPSSKCGTTRASFGSFRCVIKVPFPSRTIQRLWRNKIYKQNYRLVCVHT